MTHLEQRIFVRMCSYRMVTFLTQEFIHKRCIRELGHEGDHHLIDGGLADSDEECQDANWLRWLSEQGVDLPLTVTREWV